MIEKPINEISVNDIFRLMRNKIIESRTLDYKLNINIEKTKRNHREARRELLRDLCAFANTDGGDLIVGVKEDKGIPTYIEGIESENIDSLKLLIDSLIIDGIEPIIHYDIATLPMGRNKFILIIRVYKNWTERPYRVSYNNENRFYGRQSSRKYELSVSDLRSMFNLTVKIQDEIERIRNEGIQKIYHNQHPINFPHKTLLILHLVPILAFEKKVKFQEVVKNINHFSPMTTKNDTFNHKYNFDGIVTYYGDENGDSYLQIHESGVIEAMDSFIFSKKQIYLEEVEKMIVDNLKKKYLIGLRELKIQTPIFMYMSMVNIGEHYVSDPLEQDILKLDRKNLLFPQVVIHDYPSINVIEDVTSNNFNILWRAFGLKRTHKYYSQ